MIQLIKNLKKNEQMDFKNDVEALDALQAKFDELKNEITRLFTDKMK